MCNIKALSPFVKKLWSRLSLLWTDRRTDRVIPIYPPKYFLCGGYNKVHPLAMVNMSAKFDEEAHNGLVPIMFIRSKRDACTHGRTDRNTAALVYPLCKEDLLGQGHTTST